MEVKFEKLNSAGNDFILFKNLNFILDKNKTINLCDRKFGIGADGILYLNYNLNNLYEVEMKIYNSDGSEANMCGNGLACLSLSLIKEFPFLNGKKIKVNTKSGIQEVLVNDGMVREKIGFFSLDPKAVPYTGNNNFSFEGKTFNLTPVSVGNPHAVIIVDKFDKEFFEKLAIAMQNSNDFPDSVNVEFVKIIDEKTVEAIVYERGAGWTLSCGTGSIAIFLALNSKNLINNNLTIHWPKADLKVEKVDKDIYLILKPELNFIGIVNLD